jgi:hypothetical protein
MRLIRDLMVVFEAKVASPTSMLERYDTTSWLRSMIADEALEPLIEQQRSPELLIDAQDIAIEFDGEYSLLGVRRAALMHARESMEVEINRQRTIMRFRYLNMAPSETLAISPLAPASRDGLLIKDVVQPFKQALRRSATCQPDRWSSETANPAERRYLLDLERALDASISPKTTKPSKDAQLYYTNLDGSVFH